MNIIELKKICKVIICSYKANEIFKLCLHQLARYGFTNDDLMIYENSPSDYLENRLLLNKYNINYIDNPGGQHADTMNRALKECDTPYALLLDSDCICIEQPIYFLKYVVEHKLQLYGEIVGDRGGYHIHKRVHPWYCFVDINFMKNHNIDFVNFEKIKTSKSESFIDRTLLNGITRDRKNFYYDAGSSMFEETLENNGVCADIGDKKPYIHIEGCSWQKDFPEMFSARQEFVKNFINIVFEKCQYDEKYLALLSKNN